MYGAIAVGAIYLYNRYTKKETPKEEPNCGGGGGGGFGPFSPPTPPTPPTPPILNPNQGRSYTAEQAEQVTRAVVSQPVTTEMLRNQQAANTGATNTGGITGMGTPTSSTTTQGGNVFKPFDGYSLNGGLELSQIRRSWNRP